MGICKRGAVMTLQEAGWVLRKNTDGLFCYEHGKTLDTVPFAKNHIECPQCMRENGCNVTRVNMFRPSDLYLAIRGAKQNRSEISQKMPDNSNGG